MQKFLDHVRTTLRWIPRVVVLVAILGFAATALGVTEHTIFNDVYEAAGKALRLRIISPSSQTAIDPRDPAGFGTPVFDFEGECVGWAGTGDLDLSRYREVAVYFHVSAFVGGTPEMQANLNWTTPPGATKRALNGVTVGGSALTAAGGRTAVFGVTGTLPGSNLNFYGWVPHRLAVTVANTGGSTSALCQLHVRGR